MAEERGAEDEDLCLVLAMVSAGPACAVKLPDGTTLQRPHQVLHCFLLNSQLFFKSRNAVHTRRKTNLGGH